jgi:hypothetical protein
MFIRTAKCPPVGMPVEIRLDIFRLSIWSLASGSAAAGELRGLKVAIESEDSQSLVESKVTIWKATKRERSTQGKKKWQPASTLPAM